MAQLRDLLVNGASRFLGVVNFNDEANFNEAATFNKTALFNSTSTFKDTLTIFKSGADVDGTTTAQPSLIIGQATGTHLAIDDNEIMAKTAANTPGTLHFNINGGQVRFGCNIEPGNNGMADIGASGNRWKTIYANTFDGNATNASWADLLAIHNSITSTTTRTATRSTWQGGVTGFKYVWGQAWKDTSISSDSGDLQLGLRPSIYNAAGTELCMMIDGDYYSFGHKVAHANNSSFGAWTGGTSAGPVLNLSLGGTTLSAPAIPAASGSASGIVTTGTQTFAGAKTFSSAPTLSSGFIWPAPANISTSATENGQEWSIDLLGAGTNTYTGTYFHVWSGKLGASILACYTDDRKVKAFANMEVGSNLSVGGSAATAGGITAGGTIKSTYAGPAFFADVTAGNWAYHRLRSGNDTYMWDIAIKSNDLDGALQFRPSGAEGGRMYITRGGNVSIGGTELAIGVNKVNLKYVAATESLDFIFN